MGDWPNDWRGRWTWQAKRCGQDSYLQNLTSRRGRSDSFELFVKLDESNDLALANLFVSLDDAKATLFVCDLSTTSRFDKTDV